MSSMTARSCDIVSVSDDQLNTVADPSQVTIDRQLYRVQEENSHRSYLPPFRGNVGSDDCDVNCDGPVTDSMKLGTPADEFIGLCGSTNAGRGDAVNCGALSESCSPDSSDSRNNVCDVVLTDNTSMLAADKEVASNFVNLTESACDLMLGDVTDVNLSATESVKRHAVNLARFSFYDTTCYLSQNIELVTDSSVVRTSIPDSTFAPESGAVCIDSITKSTSNSARLYGSEEGYESEAVHPVLHSSSRHSNGAGVGDALCRGRSTFKTRAMTQQPVGESPSNIADDRLSKPMDDYTNIE
jgi:hypothetical protein